MVVIMISIINVYVVFNMCQTHAKYVTYDHLFNVPSNAVREVLF
jgi:hypothetical protein